MYKMRLMYYICCISIILAMATYLWLQDYDWVNLLLFTFFTLIHLIFIKTEVNSIIYLNVSVQTDRKLYKIMPNFL